jgi:hypothetical protein
VPKPHPIQDLHIHNNNITPANSLSLIGSAIALSTSIHDPVSENAADWAATISHIGADSSCVSQQTIPSYYSPALCSPQINHSSMHSEAAAFQSTPHATTVRASRPSSSFTHHSSACVCLDLNTKLDGLMSIVTELKANQTLLMQSVELLLNAKTTDEFDMEEFSLPVNSKADMNQLSAVLSDKKKNKFLVCSLFT